MEQSTITFTLNGETRSSDRALTVRDLIAELGLSPDVVAVEKNRSILKRESFGEVWVDEGDRLEVVEFVGGG